MVETFVPARSAPRTPVGGGAGAGAGPSTSGGGTFGGPAFHNFKPRTREEKVDVSQKGKDAVEKYRLSQRVEKFYRYDPPMDTLAHTEASPAYVTDGERFLRDASKKEQERKTSNIKKKEKFLSDKRMWNWEVDTARLAERDMERTEEQAYADRLHDRPVARNNESAEPFNIISLKYLNTPEGDRLRASDDHCKWRATRRADFLERQAHSVTHNIITGEALPKVIHVQPEPPRVKQTPTPPDAYIAKLIGDTG